MSSAIKEFNVTLANQERRIIPARGDFVFMRKSEFVMNVTLRLVDLSSSGRYISITMGQNDKIRPDLEFDEIVVFNDSGSTCAFELIAGDGDFSRSVPDRVASGDTVNIGEVDLGSFGEPVLISGANDLRKRIFIIAARANANDDCNLVENVTVPQLVKYPVMQATPTVMEITGALYGQSPTAGSVIKFVEELYSE